MSARRVNLEKALCAGQPLGGHYVTGHVDGIAVVNGRAEDARSTRMEFEVPANLARYIAKQGLCVHRWRELDSQRRDGARSFSVNLIPHTLAVTVLKDYRIGTRVNLGSRYHRALSRKTEQSRMTLNSIDEILADIRAGRMVVIMDDEDRENEGDLIMAAECARAEDVNFMARYGRGLICLTLTRDRCRQLRLPLMVNDTNQNYATNFTVSIEAAEGSRPASPRTIVRKRFGRPCKRDARPEDLRQPGHIFPLMAQPGGVLTRAGHTEAGCDLARLAGMEPASVIVEILNDDGTMARRPDLETFAQASRISRSARSPT